MTWNDVLTLDVSMFMTRVTGLETERNTVLFFEHLKNRNNANKVTDLIPKWKSMTQEEHMTVGVEYVGMFHLSRFLLMMDYLVEKAMRKDSEVTGKLLPYDGPLTLDSGHIKQIGDGNDE